MKHPSTQWSWFATLSFIFCTIITVSTICISNASLAQSGLDSNIALGKTASASSMEGGGYEADKAFDGLLGSRWASALNAATATLTVDLGGQFSISGLKLVWEAAYARSYEIQVSSDNVNFSSPIFTKTNGNGGTETIAATGQGRYVRISMTNKINANWGYSLWDVAVLGSSGAVISSSSVAQSSESSVSSVSSSSVASVASTNLAVGKPVTASTFQKTGLEAANTTDGNNKTRWSSTYTDANWISVDLGAKYTITNVKLSWETAFGKAYQIQTSLDGMSWDTIYTTTTGAGGTESLDVKGTGRYVRMNGVLRGTKWGYSLWEFEVWGVPAVASSSSISSSSKPSSSSSASSLASSSSSSAIPTNVAINRPITASTNESNLTYATYANDGNTTSRWSSMYSDANWIMVDLGGVFNISSVKLNWETAYAKAYQVDTSNDQMNWTTVYSTTSGAGGVETIPVTATGRYVRINCLMRATQWGYSLWEFEVWGASTSGGGASSSSSYSSVTGPKKGVGAPPVLGALMLFDGHKSKADSIDELNANWEKWWDRNGNPWPQTSAPGRTITYKVAHDPQYPGDDSRWTLQTCCTQIDRPWGYDDLVSKFRHHDAQIHVEFVMLGQYDSDDRPNPDIGRGYNPGGQSYSNSGIFVHSRHEVQIESTDDQGQITRDSHAMGSLVYEKTPDSNQMKENGVWQSYDIIFRSARWNGNNKVEPAYITVYWNGVKVHSNVKTYAPAAGRDNHSGEENNDPADYGVKLQAHGRDVRYRNIWIKPLVISDTNTNLLD